MSIMDFFRTAAPVAGTPANPAAQPVAAQPAPGTPGQIPPNAGAAVVPGSGDTPAATDGTVAVNTKSPMDTFSDLWKNAPNATGKGPAPLFNLDPTKMLEAAKSIPFTNAVTPEQMAAIVKGGEGAAQAFNDAMQSVAAATMMHSAVTTGNMVEQAVNKAREDFRKEIPGLVKGQTLREAVAAENPALSHPSTQPFVTLLQSQLQVKYPNATTTELRGMVSQYFDGLAGIIRPAATTKLVDASKGGDDWSKFLDS